MSTTKQAIGNRPDPEWDNLKIGIGRDFERDWMVELWKEQFGHWDEGHVEETIDAALGDDGGVHCYTIGSENALVAFAVIHFFATEHFSGRFDTDTSDWPKAVENAEMTMVCVADGWKRQGMATKLHTRACEYIRKRDVKRVFAVSWHRDRHPDSRLLFDSLGYEKLGEEDSYYAAGDDKPERHCPDCGIGCTCAASFYTTVLEDGDS